MRLELLQERGYPRLQPALRVCHGTLQRQRDLLAQGRGLFEREAAHHAPRDLLRLVAGASRGLRRRPLRGRGGRARAQADERGQHLAGDARGAGADPVQDHLGEHHRGQVLARTLVHHLDLVPGGHQPAQPFQGDVAPGVRVVELAVAVAAHDAGPPLRHAPTITRCVMRVKCV
jgi:hypothetical protein